MLGGGAGRGGGGSVGRGGRGRGGRRARRGARRQRRARAPRLEEEPGPGGGLTGFPGDQRPPPALPSPRHRGAAAARRAPAAAQPQAAAGARCARVRPRHRSPRPRRAGGAESARRPALRPAAALRGCPGAPRLQRGLPARAVAASGSPCVWAGPRSPGPRPAARPTARPGSGATCLPRRGRAPTGGRGDSARLDWASGASTPDRVQGSLRGIRQQEVSFISRALLMYHSSLHAPAVRTNFPSNL